MFDNLIYLGEHTGSILTIVSQASFVGWHLAGHQLTPEDEIFSLRKVIASFQTTIKEVKANS